MIRYSFLSLLIAISLISCYEDSLIDTTTTTTFTPGVRFVHDVSGRVVDRQGQDISNATIEIAALETTTDDDGRFLLKDVEIPQDGIFVAASRAGYANSGTTAYTATSLKTEVLITMLEADVVGNFRGDMGGTVTTADGTPITFLANSVQRAEVPYADDVYVSVIAYAVDGSEPFKSALNVYDYKPDKDGALGKVSPVFQIEVTLRDVDGNVLSLDPMLPARASLTLPQGSAQSLPLQLFSFDQKSGYWKYENDLTTSSGQVEVEMNHFSWWQVASAYPTTYELCIDFNAINGSAPDDDIYTVVVEDQGLVHFGTIPYDQTPCITVPTDVPLEIHTYNYCVVSKGIYEVAVPAAGQTMVTKSIDIDQVSTTFIIKGTITKCTGIPLAQDVTVFVMDGLTVVSEHVVNGSYEIQLDECADIARSSLTFFEPGTENIVAIVPDLLSGINVIDVDFCFTNTEESFFQLAGLPTLDCIAKKNPEETLIYIDGESTLIFGFEGFTEGTFDCNIIYNSIYYEGAATITEYGEVGGVIRGTVAVVEIGKSETVTGSFIAKRVK